MNFRPRTLAGALLWPVLLLFLLVSILSALQWYMDLDLNAFDLQDLSFSALALATAAQLLAMFMTILAWHWNLTLHNAQELRLLQSVVMSGFSAIGKYTPGKIWGMIARGAMHYKLSQKKSEAVRATVIEQIALVHSGISMAALGFLTFHGYTILAVLAAIIAAASSWFIAIGGNHFHWFTSFFKRKCELTHIDFSNDSINRCYPIVFLVLTLMWLLVSMALWACAHALSDTITPEISLIVMVTTLSFLGGFIAFFSPAGLGVREGIIVALLGPHIGVPTALYVSLLHRLITAGCDVALGLFSLLAMNAALPRAKE